ncbi:MAG: alpha/beta fold hydrolase, partial [Rhizobacter sp.]
GVREALDALGNALFAGGRQSETPGLRLAGRELRVLVVWGAEDRIVPAAHARHAPPGATVEVLAGAGHMVMMEKASEVNALLKRHIAA